MSEDDRHRTRTTAATGVTPACKASLAAGWIEDEIVVREARNLGDDVFAVRGRRLRVFRKDRHEQMPATGKEHNARIVCASADGSGLVYNARPFGKQGR